MDKLKSWKDLHQRDVVDIQDDVNKAADLSLEAQRALALHDNMVTLGCLNDFILLIDLIDLDYARRMEVKDIHLTKNGVEQRKGADVFRENLKNIVTRKRDQLIDILDKMEETTYEETSRES